MLRADNGRIRNDGAGQVTRSGGGGGELEGVAEARDGALAAEDRDHFVDAGADGAAGQGDADRLRELAELVVEAGEHAFESGLNRRLGEVCAKRVEFTGNRF